jgi:hypothetical protein
VLLSRRSIRLAALALGLTATAAVAQTTYPNVRVTGRLQEQFYYFGNEDYAAVVGSQSNFFTRRARIEARVAINEYISAFIQPSFEGGRSLSASVTCAPITVDPTGGAPVTIPISCTSSGTGGVRLRDAYVDVRFN